MEAVPHIRVKSLTVRYGEKEILHEIDLSVEQGEFVAIVGKSGSGKSTLLYALAGFIKSQGQIEMPIDVGMVFQNYVVFPWLTVEGNIAFGLHDRQERTRREVVENHLNMIGLTDHAKKYPGQLSGGQIQRVALARALAPNPEILFMDEPFGALDFYTREKIQTSLLDIWEKNHKTVLFVTHNIEEAIFLADRVLIVGEGDILKEYEVPLERPRLEQMKYTGQFIELRKQILQKMEGNVFL